LLVNSLRLLLFAPRTALAKARAQLFTLEAFFVRDAMPHLCKQQPTVAFSAQGIERKYRKAPPERRGLRNWRESPVSRSLRRMGGRKDGEMRPNYYEKTLGFSIRVLAVRRSPGAGGVL
jgi:hypothetical protein